MPKRCAVVPALLMVIASLDAYTAETNAWTDAKLPPEAAGATLRGICFADAQHGWIVGDKGLCLATSDGGATWSRQDTGSTATLRGVRFNDTKTGFACGDGDLQAPKATAGHFVMGRPEGSGSLLATADGGKTWKQRWVPCNFEVWCVETSAAPVLQAGIGWDEHLDGDIVRSADGGEKWESYRIYRSLSDIRAQDAQRWIAVGSPVSVGFSGNITDAAYLAKACRALFSRDGGKTWTPAKGSDGAGCLRGLWVKKGLALAVGDGGAILASEDAGENWKACTNTETSGLRAIAASFEGETIVAAGERGTFVVSTDGGKTWRASWVGRNTRLYAIAASKETFWAVGENGAALKCDCKALAADRPLPAPPPPAEKKQPVTDFQRARVRVGDFAVYAIRAQCAALGLNIDCQVKNSITAVKGDAFTMASEVVKGTPPPGTPMKSEAQGNLSDISDYNAWEIGKTVEGKEGMLATKTLRSKDEPLEIKEKKLHCIVLSHEGELPGGQGKISGKRWICATDEVPISGLIKMEGVQVMSTPNGAKLTISNAQELIEWGRGKP